MLYTFDYDRNYVPSAPAAEILIGRAQTEPTLSLTAMVDSGADASLIPIVALTQVRARKGRQAWLRGMTGQRIAVDLYLISLRLGPYSQQALWVAGGISPDEIILGRDVLNHLVVTLNGLASIVEIPSYGNTL